MTHDYKRHGTTTLFAALSLLDGRVIGDCMPRHRHQEFIRFLKQIDGTAPSALDLHLIVDNYGTHKHLGCKHGCGASALPPALHPDVQFVAEPGGTLVPRLTTQRLRRGSFDSVEELIAAIYAYLDNHNQNPRVFVWSALWIESSRRSPNVKKR